MAAPSRNITLQCLTEIGSLTLGPEHNQYFERLFHQFMTQLVQIIPPGIDLRRAYDQGSEDEQNFIQNLGLFFAGFLKAHIAFVETPDLKLALLEALKYLASISTVDDDEVFKICLEYWNHLASDLYHEYGICWLLILQRSDVIFAQNASFVDFPSDVRVSGEFLSPSNVRTYS